MTGLTSIRRGLATRAGSSVMMLIVALVATAAATAGPAYFAASQTSILHDTVASVPYIGRGFEVTQTGSAAGTLTPLATEVHDLLARYLGSAAQEQRVFDAPIEALETTAFLSAKDETVPLAWRSDVCAHLQIRGSCPQASDQVLVSSSLAAVNDWTVGASVRFAQWGPLRVVGVYTPPNPADYWFGRGSTYFPYENPVLYGRRALASAYDAMFTPRVTIEDAPETIQGTAVIDDLMDEPGLHPGAAGRVSTAVTQLVNSSTLADQQAIVSSEIPATVATVQRAWSSEAVPILLVTLQLLGLAWLLLFLVVTDAVDARGPEVALARLRGYGRFRTVAFGLSEPLAILLVCLPIGALAGWGATTLLAHALLRPGTPVALPGLGWAAAGVATLGGLIAVGLAAQHTLRRSVVEQWRRAGRRATDRGWVVDAVLLTGAAAGLLELTLTGQVASARHGALSLLFPGLLGLAVAVVASRLLPLGCRAIARRRTGGLATFLAVCHVARRPGGLRTTIMLATSFSLATFALAAWTVSDANDHLVADAQIGAPTVLTVAPPAGQNLGDVVDRADPSGRLAAGVEEYSSNGVVTLAVDPSRFAKVAAWRPQFATEPISALAARLDPPAPPALVLNGDVVRVRVTINSLDPPGTDLQLDVVTPTSTGSTPVDLGPLPGSGSVTVTAPLTGCPCTVQDLTLVPNPALGAAQVTGILTLSGLQVHGPGGWTSVADVFNATGRWEAGDVHNPPDRIGLVPTGLRWQFDTPGVQDATLVSINRPIPLPALVAAPLLAQGPGNIGAVGLDGQALPVQVVAGASAIPGAPADGVLVDRSYAELAAGGDLVNVTDEVWVAKGAAQLVESRLSRDGVRVLASQSAGQAASTLRRQGPGLASVLFLAEAAAAAVLAATGAVLGLYLSARRRRYEYAALSVAGLTRRTLFEALLAEQAMVLVFGSVVGIASGTVAAIVALRNVPEFLTVPTAPPLRFLPPVFDMIAILGLAIAAVLITIAVASVALVRSVRLDVLREGLV